MTAMRNVAGWDILEQTPFIDREPYSLQEASGIMLEWRLFAKGDKVPYGVAKPSMGTALIPSEETYLCELVSEP